MVQTTENIQPRLQSFFPPGFLNENKKPKRFESSQLLRKTWHVNQRFYKFSWILTVTEVIQYVSIQILRMRLISAIMNFYWSHVIALQKLSN